MQGFCGSFRFCRPFSSLMSLIRLGSTDQIQLPYRRQQPRFSRLAEVVAGEQRRSLGAVAEVVEEEVRRQTQQARMSRWCLMYLRT